MEQFFSYGTLRSKEIQMRVFNRILNGTPDQLLGHKLKDLQIEEEFGIEDYHVAIASENLEDYQYQHKWQTKLFDFQLKSSDYNRKKTEKTRLRLHAKTAWYRFELNYQEK